MTAAYSTEPDANTMTAADFAGFFPNYLVGFSNASYENLNVPILKGETIFFNSPSGGNLELILSYNASADSAETLS